MASVREALDDLGEHAYRFARRIGMTEYKFNRLRKGRVKTITDSDVEKIATGLKFPLSAVRAELERRKTDHLEDVGRAA